MLGTATAPQKIHTDFAKKDYAKMVADALTKSGVVLVCWQHEDIPLQAEGDVAGISQEILTQTGTKAKFLIPPSWPKDSNGQARYDLIFAFTRDTTSGQISGFELLPQYLVAGDGAV